jgi:6-phosphofructokinase 2
MQGILTLTMNPALDVSTEVDHVEPEHKLRCAESQTHPGGGGINVARVMHRLGADCLALYPSGGLTGQTLTQLLHQEGVPTRVTAMAGETRQSFSAHEACSGKDYRFVLPGPRLSEAEWQVCLDEISVLRPACLVASGSLPPGVPDDFYARLARLLKTWQGRLALDSSGPALLQAVQEGVWLIKPSLRELQALTGLALPTLAERLAAARALIAQGRAQIVALSMGPEGALLVSASGAWHAEALQVPVASTIGAGDSFVGGLIWALSRTTESVPAGTPSSAAPAGGQDLAEAFSWAMAAASAALLSSGTALCQAADVSRLQQTVQVTRCPPA